MLYMIVLGSLAYCDSHISSDGYLEKLTKAGYEDTQIDIERAIVDGFRLEKDSILYNVLGYIEAICENDKYAYKVYSEYVKAKDSKIAKDNELIVFSFLSNSAQVKDKTIACEILKIIDNSFLSYETLVEKSLALNVSKSICFQQQLDESPLIIKHLLLSDFSHFYEGAVSPLEELQRNNWATVSPETAFLIFQQYNNIPSLKESLIPYKEKAADFISGRIQLPPNAKEELLKKIDEQIAENMKRLCDERH